MVADEQHRSLRGDMFEPAYLRPEVQARHQPRAGEHVADVVRVPLVEVGRRDPAGHLARDAASQPADHLSNSRESHALPVLPASPDVYTPPVVAPGAGWSSTPADLAGI